MAPNFDHFLDAAKLLSAPELRKAGALVRQNISARDILQQAE